MEPEEIIEHIAAQNRSILNARGNLHRLTHEQVLHLMNTAAMQGFRFGSESALSMVKSKLVIKYMSEATSSEA